MLFNSLHFIFFFPTAVAIYLATPRDRRWLWLLISSYYFYMCWNPRYVLLILCSTLVDYVAALQMARYGSKRARRALLGVSLGVNLGLLGVFKYFNFMAESLERAFHAFNLFADLPSFDALLPVGISFYTFQTLSYTLDVYKGRIEPERHLGYFAVFVAFWPQLVAGPIERSSRLLPQLHAPSPLDAARLGSGLSIMLWGFFQKLVIADRLAPYVAGVYDLPAGEVAGISGGTVWLATYAFAIQIYCDFSGYSLIAIGAARILGIDLMINFRRPYMARSVAEFWNRWHISLSTWFRDYVYIPLGGNRGGRARHFRNLLLTFAVSGLWHGAGWTFVIWGMLHGVYLVVTLLSAELRRRMRSAAHVRHTGFLARNGQRFATFHAVLFGWIFFRAADLPTAWALLERMATGPLDGLRLTRHSLTTGSLDPWLALILCGALVVQDAVLSDREVDEWLAELKPGLRFLWHTALAACILWLGVFSSQEFIYFQF